MIVMKIFRLFILIFVLIFISCQSDNKYVNIGTFNIQWLGDGEDDNVIRSESDISNIAEVIRLSDADLLGLQEVENEAAMSLLIEKLEDYDYEISNYGSYQNQAVIFKKGIDVRNFRTYYPLKINEDTRAGIVVEINLYGKKINFMSVHLKSTSRYDSTQVLREISYKYRKSQAEILSKWADSLSERDEYFIITGDFNDNPKRKSTSIGLLENNTDLIFLTDEFTSCKNKLWKSIDHILISKNLKKYYMNGSNRIINTYNMFTDSVAEKVSDHCPVVATFKFNP
jgi:endonuclease/exonuclease/phosphatase family metal-dependent hydrolase